MGTYRQASAVKPLTMGWNIFMRSFPLWIIRLLTVVLLTCWVGTVLGASKRESWDYLDGDVIFQTSRSSQSQAIQLATKSSYSHVGMIVIRDGRPWVFEAVGPVKLTPLASWIARGINRDFVVKRLSDRSVITPKKKAMRAWIQKMLGRRYDWGFRWTNQRMYCSELIWKLYEDVFDVRLAKLKALRTFNTHHPVVKRRLQKRYGKKIPWNERMVSPGQLFDSKHLVPVSNQ